MNATPSLLPQPPLSTEEQLFVDSRRNAPDNIHEAYDLLKIFLKDEFDPGLTQAFFDALNHPPTDPDIADRRLAYIDAADCLSGSDGYTIDEDAWVAESAEGAYVQAWVWVSKGDIE